MTIRNMDAFFAPRSVAFIGASERPGTVGAVLMRNLIEAGFQGPIHPINPKHATIMGRTAYPSVAALPTPADLAVIATPPASIPGLVAELGRAGTCAVVVITAGLGAAAQMGRTTLRQQMLDAAQPHLTRIIGPNCLGIIMPHARLDASFGPTRVAPGRIAFVSQSGAMATAVLDWAASRGIGFSSVLTLGDMADVDFGDSLDFLARDGRTRAILLYIEQVTHARKFMSAARAAARNIPVVVVKAGRFAEGARAAASHTGALAGSDAVYDAAIRRAGMVRVTELDELFEAVETLSRMGVPCGERLAIVTNGGGAGVLATDALIARKGRLAALTDATITALDRHLPATWSHANPVDIIGDADAERYAATLEVVLAAPEVDAVLVLNCPTAIVLSEGPARATIKAASQQRKPVIAGWLGGAAAEPARRLFSEAGVPSLETPARAVRAFMHLIDYARAQTALGATPPSLPSEFTPDTARVRRLIDQILTDGREMATEVEAKAVLAAYDIPTARTLIAATPEDAARIASDLKFPVALKIHSRDITHKSDVGGVALNLPDAAAVEAEARAMLARIGVRLPHARLDGFAVQEMIQRPHAHELIVGVGEDAQFGPVLMLGAGGIAVEAMTDTTFELPPLDMLLARRMIGRIRIARLLAGYRDRKPADHDRIALTLVKVSQLIADFAEIAEIDINPLLADADGVVALDARIQVRPSTGHPHARLAIKPYPNELEATLRLKDGRTLELRPIRAEDEPALQAAFAKLTPDEIRMRFHAPMAALAHPLAARLAQINYDREIALLLIDPSAGGPTPDIVAITRYAADPDNERAEYAIIVRHDFTGQGLGRQLMDRLIETARARGIRSLFGDVLAENARMLSLTRELGFTVTHDPDAPEIMHTTLDLTRQHA